MRLSASDPYDLCERISLLTSSVHKPCRDLRGRLRRRPSYMWATFDQGACCWRKGRLPLPILPTVLPATLETCFGEDNRPIFLNRTNVKSLDVAQVGDTLYYLSAGFLTFKQSEFTSCLSADRPLLRLEC